MCWFWIRLKHSSPKSLSSSIPKSMVRELIIVNKFGFSDMVNHGKVTSSALI